LIFGVWITTFFESAPIKKNPQMSLQPDNKEISSGEGPQYWMFSAICLIFFLFWMGFISGLFSLEIWFLEYWASGKI
jgi:hypothetical protein